MSYRFPLRASALVVCFLTGAAACNAITGADDLVLKDDASGTGGASGTNAVVVGSSATGSNIDPTPLNGAAGVTIREINLYQGVRRPLMTAGAPAASTVPVVFGRDGILRVFYDTDASYNNQPVIARLYLEGQTVLEVEETLFPTSTEGNLTTTINFELTADVMRADAVYRVELLQDPKLSPTDNPAAKYPAEGSASFGVDPSPVVLQVRLVPVAYQADGSGRVPDTSPAQIQRYQDMFYSIYPVTSAEITVREPMPWSSVIDPFGTGWQEVLDAVAQQRQVDGAPPNVFYYGIFAPATSAGQYCSGGCVAGLGYLPGPGDNTQRAAVGLGYPDANLDTETAVHEIGHSHGRMHAPCGGAGGPDPAYPYVQDFNGDGEPETMGTVWGYNILSRQLIDPAAAQDLMGYCVPIWISDYNFSELFTRIQFYDGAKLMVPPDLLDRTYDRLRINQADEIVHLDPIQLHEPPSGEPTQIQLETAAGPQTVTGQLYRYDHLPGGLLYWPRTQAAVTGVTVHLDGRELHSVR